MRIPPQRENGADDAILALSISPFSEDHIRLREILGAESRCALITCDTLDSAAPLISRHEFAVIICEYDLSPGSWRDVIAMMSARAVPPSLVVSSHLADERKWAEILNLGAFDLVIKPFVAEEVCRVVSAACRHWYQQREAQVQDEVCRALKQRACASVS